MDDAPFIPTWLDDLELRPAPFRVLCHLWRCRNRETGQCNPGVARIAGKCRMNRDTVWSALRELESQNLIERKPRPGGSNNYLLKPGSGKEGVAEKEGCPPAEKRGCPVAEKEGRGVAEKRGCEGTQEKVHKGKSTKEGAQLVAEFPEVLDVPEFREAWSIYERHRREIRKKLTPSSASALLRKLAGWGAERAAAAIRHSVTNGWQGVFEEKAEGSPGGKQMSMDEARKALGSRAAYLDDETLNTGTRKAKFA